ncbi:MAG TPA: PLP-dependent lyase/thiolase [Gammaproteobacteria bacterium]|jgi:threonine dehydratase|nr:PLP-dependent lyase/thiolase [Gammaproteobacteria bacterium]
MNLKLPSLPDIQHAFTILRLRNISSAFAAADNCNLFLKCDNTLPACSYKIRGVEYFANQLKSVETVSVLSAGNLALAAAMRLREDHVNCEAVVPEGISQIKADKLTEAGAIIKSMPFTEIWRLVQDHSLRQSNTFLHPLNYHLLAGYASVIIELHQDGFMDGALVIPYGLGGLATAVARAIELTHSNIKLYLCEIDTASPFTRALQAGKPVFGPRLQSFIEAMGTPEVITDVFEYLRPRIAGVITVTVDEAKIEVHRAQQQYQLRIEGAAAASLAAARKLAKNIRTTALLTGSNISPL